VVVVVVPVPVPALNTSPPPPPPSIEVMAPSSPPSTPVWPSISITRSDHVSGCYVPQPVVSKGWGAKEE